MSDKNPKDKPAGNDDQSDEMKDFFEIMDAMDSPIKQPLIQIMSAKGQPVIRNAAEALRQAELLLVRRDTHFKAVGQLISGTLTYLDDFIKEYDGAVITTDFVRRAKELRARLRLEFKAHKE